MAEDEATEEEGGGLFAVPDFSPAVDGLKKAGAAAKGIGLGMISPRGPSPATSRRSWSR